MTDILLMPMLILGAYLLGSISTAIIVCKLMGLPDPRTLGSRNPGATNVARIGGKKAAALTLLGDMLKGLVPVLLAHALGADAICIGRPYLWGLGAYGQTGVELALKLLTRELRTTMGLLGTPTLSAITNAHTTS